MTEAPATSVPRGPVERWLLRHTWLTVVVVVAAGLAIRIAAIRGTRLGSDEAVHFQLVNVSSIWEVYRATLTNAHPPLFFFLLHLWHLIGTSEFFLRLLPVLFGTALLGVAYRWADHLFGKSAALFTLAILAFSPAVVALSAEVRGYTLLLFLMVSALLVLERAIERRSVIAMLGFSGLLYLAILTHYSAFWFTLAAFTYVLIRIRAEHLPKSLIATWLVFQVGAAALYAFLYFSHLVNLRGSELERAARNHADYFYAEQESIFTFLARQTSAFFRALFGSPAAAFVGLTAVALGIALLVSRKRPAALLLALPFLLGAAGGLARLYPYGGTRHAAYLMPFAAVAFGVAAAATTGRLWPALLVGVMLAGSSGSEIASRRPNITEMKAAVEAIRAAAAPGSLLFSDLHTGLTLSYYLGGSDFFHENPTPTHFWKSGAGGYRLVGSHQWAFNAKRFSSELQQFIESYSLSSGQTVWIIHVGPELNPAQVLSQQYPTARLTHKFQFGDIAVVEVRLP
ncbi:MAG TPA: glycosyltransferase family 39 protein [Thermoanaerobaculia bacterium]